MPRALAMIFLVVSSLAAPGRARADAPLTILDDDYRVALRALDEQLDEPVGLRATKDIPALGLRKGDIVRTIDGDSAVSSRVSVWIGAYHGGATMAHLGVLRGGRTLVISLAIRFPATQDAALERTRLTELVARSRELGTTLSYAPVTSGGQPSGVLVREAQFAAPYAYDGDIIRRIDGKTMTTGDDVLRAIDAGAQHDKIVIDLDRVGQAMTLKLVLAGPSAAAVTDFDKAIQQIVAIDSSHFTLPKRVIDLVMADPSLVAKAARIVPAIRDGKPAGFKLYAIRPDSPFARLGLANGDTITAVNGSDLTTADRALDVFVKLMHATVITVDGERRGQPFELHWTVQP